MIIIIIGLIQTRGPDDRNTDGNIKTIKELNIQKHSRGKANVWHKISDGKSWDIVSTQDSLDPAGWLYIFA